MIVETDDGGTVNMHRVHEEHAGSEKWVMRVPVLSTGHIDSDTLEYLKLMQFPKQPYVQVAEYEEGAFVFVSKNAASDAEFPTALQPVLKWFRQHYPEEAWIRFDRDGDEIEGLPTYDW